ncbi:MAG: protein kinase [Polyangiales bacterium]
MLRLPSTVAMTSCPSCSEPVTPGDVKCARCGLNLKLARRDRNLGAVIGNLRLVDRLGVGGMGAVYRAEHVSMGTPYAVKVLHPQFSEDEVVAERFRREAITCSKLRHENTVFVTDFGASDDVGLYLVMEFLEGRSLHAILREPEGLSLARFGRLAGQVCDAMAAAHHLGIVHRDLKPENVMVLDDKRRPDRVKVLDFGIAQLREGGDDEPKITRAGSVVGTPAYMSPEQIDRRVGAVSPASDIYALGVIFHECVTGRRPFDAEGDLALVTHHLSQPPDPLSASRPELAGTLLEGLVLDMLAKKPAERPASMDVVRERLDQALAELEAAGLIDVAAPASQPGTHPTGPSRPSFPGVRADPSRSNPSLQFAPMVHRIIAESPGSPAATLLAAMPNADVMGSDALAVALWGVLQHEILEAPMSEARFVQSLTHLALLIDTTLAAHPEPPATPAQERILKALKHLVSRAAPDRQRRIGSALAMVIDHPLMPPDVFPSDAKPAKGSTWNALKGVMTKEIHLWPAKGEGRASQPPPEPAPPQAEGDAATDDASLVDKFKQPVSLKSVKAVLTHEISLFGKKPKG